jgi:uncharacterized protein YkwD
MQINTIKCCIIQKLSYLCNESSPKFDLPRIMKPVTYILLALTLGLTSCSKEELVETQSPIEYTIDLNLAQETDAQMASEILFYVNEYRSTLGLEPIIMDRTYASAYAVEHTKYMIQQNRISHDGFSSRAEGLNSQGAQAVAENVGFGYSSAQDLVSAWINSPSHRDTLEGNYTHSGIGALPDGSGVYYVTQLFYRK